MPMYEPWWQKKTLLSLKYEYVDMSGFNPHPEKIYVFSQTSFVIPSSDFVEIKCGEKTKKKKKKNNDDS